MKEQQNQGKKNSTGKKLGWFLCWAIVFADIGTSLYYVPGILFGEVGNLAGIFILLTSVIFILLVLKYVEIADRYPEGGGVVTVATHAFGPWLGALGGMFITVDYFLTASISTVSGITYLSSIIGIGQFIAVGAIIALMFLGILNIIGIKESASVTAVVAVAAFIVDILLLFFVATQIKPEGWQLILNSFSKFSGLKPINMLTGFAGAFLAFSGLESISQLSPAMQTPRKRTGSIAMALVVGAILITSPFLTFFSTNLLTAKTPDNSSTIIELVSQVKAREEKLLNDEKEKAQLINDPAAAAKVQNIIVDEKVLEEEIKLGKEYSERFMSELGGQYGGTALKIAVVITASILLLFAANTAIIGAYHVFISLSRNKFLPEKFQEYNNKFDTPHWAVLLAVVPPIIIVFLTKGDVNLLGQLYAFGLLGAFSLTSMGLDIVRWKEQKKISLKLLVGVVTSLLVVLAWTTNLIYKPLATAFGGIITVLGMVMAYLVYRKLTKIPEVAEMLPGEIKDYTKLPKELIFVPVYHEFDSKLFDYVGHYSQSIKKGIALLYIREFSSVLGTVSENIEYDEVARKYLQKAREILHKYNIQIYELYKTSSDTGDTINAVRDKIKPSLTIVSPHAQSLLLNFLHGDILSKIVSHKGSNVLIFTGK